MLSEITLAIVSLESHLLEMIHGRSTETSPQWSKSRTVLGVLLVCYAGRMAGLIYFASMHVISEASSRFAVSTVADLDPLCDNST